MRVRRITVSIEDQQRFVELWTGGIAVSVICGELGLSSDSVRKLRMRLGLVARTAKTRAAPAADPRPPTPQEIRRATRILREKHLAKRRAERPRVYRDEDEIGGRICPDSLFDIERRDPGSSIGSE
jgi:hypothetical protein